MGQRPLCVLPIADRVWASARVLQFEDWFQSWVPGSVFSAGGGRSSVEAWHTAALDNEEVLSGVADFDVHLFVADVIRSFDTGAEKFGASWLVSSCLLRVPLARSAPV